MRKRQLLAALAGAVPIGLPSVVSADTCAPPEGVFAPGAWHAHGFAEFSGSDSMAVQAGYQELRFDLRVDSGGVVTDGGLAMTAGGTAAALDGMSGAEANWTVTGALSGVASSVQFDGEFQMDIDVSQTMTGLGGGSFGIDTPLSIGPDPATFTFRPTDADCTFAVGVLTGTGLGQDGIPWTALRSGRGAGGTTAERYESLTRRGVELAAASDIDLDALVGLLRDLIGFTTILSRSTDCLGGNNATRIGSPQVAYAQHVLRAVLQRFVETLPNFSVPVIIQVMSLGFEASGLQSELCGVGGSDTDGLLAGFEAELIERFRQSIIDDDEVAFRQILAAAQQFGMTSILALASQMAVQQ